MPNVMAPRIENHEDWKRPEWVADMVAALAKDTYFRWFDSGDMYALRLAEKIYEVMAATPWVSHWLPTRMAKFAKFDRILTRMSRLQNVMVRFSSDGIDGGFTEGVHGSCIVPSADDAPDNVSVCGAYSRAGKCGGCRSCWDKTIPVIGYPQHGAKIAKVWKLKVAEMLAPA
jgi:hypothetical protein